MALLASRSGKVIVTDDGTNQNLIIGGNTVLRIVKATEQIETPASITNDVPM